MNPGVARSPRDSRRTRSRRYGKAWATCAWSRSWSSPGDYDATVADPRLDSDRLGELIAGANEWEELDYKESLDLTRPALFDLVTDIAAMAARGGYLVIGVADDGTPVGIDPAKAARDLDEPEVRKRIHRYLPDIEIRCAVRERDGLTFGLIWVGTHRDGFAILAVDGQWADGKTQVTAFRGGDVYARRGTQSVRIRHTDMAALRDRFAETIRRRVRAEWVAEFAAGMSISGPMAAQVPSLGWQLPLDEFHSRAIRVVEAGGTTAIKVLLSTIRAQLGAGLRCSVGRLESAADAI